MATADEQPIRRQRQLMTQHHRRVCPLLRHHRRRRHRHCPHRPPILYPAVEAPVGQEMMAQDPMDTVNDDNHIKATQQRSTQPVLTTDARNAVMRGRRDLITGLASIAATEGRFFGSAARQSDTISVNARLHMERTHMQTSTPPKHHPPPIDDTHL